MSRQGLTTTLLFLQENRQTNSKSLWMNTSAWHTVQRYETTNLIIDQDMATRINHLIPIYRYCRLWPPHHYPNNKTTTCSKSLWMNISAWHTLQKYESTNLMIDKAAITRTNRLIPIYWYFRVWRPHHYPNKKTPNVFYNPLNEYQCLAYTPERWNNANFRQSHVRED